MVVFTLVMSAHRLLSLRTKYGNLAGSPHGSDQLRQFDKYQSQLRAWRFRVAAVQQDCVCWYALHSIIKYSMACEWFTYHHKTFHGMRMVRIRGTVPPNPPPF